MAGSERNFIGKDDQLVKQQNIINTANSAFTNVLKQINDGNTHISFRSNTLTSFLRKELVQSKITLILLVSPSALEESQRTINFGADVLNVKTSIVPDNSGIKTNTNNESDRSIDDIFNVVKNLSPPSQLSFRQQYMGLFGHSKDGDNSFQLEQDSDNENRNPQVSSNDVHDDQSYDNTHLDLELVDLENRNPQTSKKKPRKSEAYNLTRRTNNPGSHWESFRDENRPQLRSGKQYLR